MKTFIHHSRIRNLALLGTFLTCIALTASANEIIVKAKGSKANGQYAHFSVLVNNQEIGSRYTSCSFEEYRFSLHSNDEIKEVKIKYDNDMSLGDEDRNLFVCSITIGDMPTLNAIDGVAEYYFQNGNKQVYSGMMGRNGTLVFNINAIKLCPENVTLSSQAQVNAFNCQCIKGSLTISGNDITDLSPLSMVTSIRGPLNITNNANLAIVSGMDALVEIAFLSITNNPKLERIDGFNSMQKCGGIMVNENEKLKTIKCFHTPNL